MIHDERNRTMRKMLLALSLTVGTFVATSAGAAPPASADLTYRTCSPYQTLSIGSTGECVFQTQQRLNRMMAVPIPVDGRFGPITALGVRHYQWLIGVSVDGVAGPATLVPLFGPPPAALA